MKLNKLQKFDLENWICGKIIDGISKNDIINIVVRDYPSLNKSNAIQFYINAKTILEEKAVVKAEEVINQHMRWYEKLYHKFDVLNYISGKNAVLRQKEKILGLLRDENVINITNEINVGANNHEYDKSKLTLEESERLEGYLNKINIQSAYDYHLELELKRDLFTNSYFEFFKWAFNVLFPTEYYEDNFHIKYLCDLLQEEAERILRREEKDQDIIINVPPRTSKSLITSVCFIAWVWIKNPTATFICVSYDEDLSYMNAQYSRDLIRNEEYQKLFGHIFKIRNDIDGKGLFQNSKGGFRLSKTTGSNITGHKGLFVMVDDPQSPKTSESETKRKETINYYTQALYNRLTPINLGVRIIIMQRLHEEDLTGYLEKNNKDEYRHIVLPAQENDDIKPTFLKSFYKNGLLDPIRLSLKILQGFMKALGTRGYVGQYGQRPAPKEGGIFKKEWFDIVYPETLIRDTVNEPIHFIIDSAYTEKTSNDPTAIMTCFHKNNCIYVLDVIEVWMEFPELIRFLKSHTAKYQLSSDSKIFIEPKASGKSIAQQLRAETKLNVIETVPPDKDKVVRANAVSPKVESRRVKLIMGSYIDNYLNQLGSFPNATHDDMVDVTVNAIDTLLPANDNPDFIFM